MWYQTLDILVSEFAASPTTSKSLSSLENKARRKLALLLQNDETYESKFVLKGPAKLSIIEAAILLHWYLPAYWKFELELAIQEKVNRLDDESKAWCLELLTSKYVCLYYLGPLMSQNDYHGNTVRAFERILSSMDFLAEPTRRPRPKTRRRGYQDHGSLRPVHQWRERSPWSDVNFREQLELERQNWELIRTSLPLMKIIFRKVG